MSFFIGASSSENDHFVDSKNIAESTKYICMKYIEFLCVCTIAERKIYVSFEIAHGDD